jgi:molybdopterin-guanine dinucleotide biosynthesis protein A
MIGTVREPLPAASAKFTAVLLAGGQSVRMGRDKAGLLLDGQPLWRRQLATLAETGPAEVFISGKLDGPYADAGVEIVLDASPGLGPLGGIAAALHRAAHPLVLVLAIDLPDMRADFLRDLIESATASEKGLVTRDDRCFQPLAAVYSRPCLPLTRECLAGKDHSMQNFVRLAVERGLICPRHLMDHEIALFRNVNEPSDL